LKDFRLLFRCHFRGYVRLSYPAADFPAYPLGGSPWNISCYLFRLSGWFFSQIQTEASSAQLPPLPEDFPVSYVTTEANSSGGNEKYTSMHSWQELFYFFSKHAVSSKKTGRRLVERIGVRGRLLETMFPFTKREISSVCEI